MDSQMQIGWATQQIERAHEGGSLVSDIQLFHGTAGNRDPWHLVQRKKNTWQQAKLHVRLSG